MIEDKWKQVPCAKGRHLTPVLRLSVQPLQHGDIRIGNLVVAGDAWIGKPSQRLVVTRIRKVKAIGDEGVGPAIAIAEDLSIPRNHRPQKGHQRLPARLRSVPPIILLELCNIGNRAPFLGHQRGFRAFEDFLPAEAVGHDEDDIVSLMRRRWRGHRRNASKG